MPRPKGSSEGEDVMGGFPETGDELPIDNEDNSPEPDERPEPPAPDPLKEVQARLARIEAENEALRKAIPPATPKGPPTPSGQGPDWDNLLFTNPKEAVALIKKEAKEEVTQELTANYQRDQSTKQFWNKFYSKNKDLKNDHDLVEVTLNSNLADLANIPVETAMERLADLTRQRILRYTGEGGSRGKKVKVEGADAPSGKRPEKATAEVTSLSDIIRARRTKRSSAA